MKLRKNFVVVLFSCLLVFLIFHVTALKTQTSAQSISTLPSDGDAWTENDNSTVTWSYQSFQDKLSWDTNKVHDGSYSLKVNHTGNHTKLYFKLDLKENRDVSNYDFLTFWYYREGKAIDFLFRTGDTVWSGNMFALTLKPTNETWTRFAVPLWAFAEVNNPSWATIRYLTWYHATNIIGSADHTCVWIDGLHFTTWEELSLESSVDDTFMANFYGFFNKYAHADYSLNGKLYTGIRDWLNTTTGDAIGGNLQNEALGQALYALGKAYETYPSQVVLGEINLLGNWFSQFPANNSYGAPPCQFNSVVGFADTCSAPQAGWSLAGFSMAYKVTQNATYREGADRLRRFICDYMWKGLGSGTFYNSFTISTGTASGTIGSMGIGAMLTGLGTYYHYVSQNATVRIVIQDIFDGDEGAGQVLYGKFSDYGDAENVGYSFTGWYECAQALNNATIWDWGKRIEELFFMYGMNSNHTVMSHSAYYNFGNTTHWAGSGKKPWGLITILPVAVECNENRSISEFKACYENAIWDSYIATEKTAIWGIYFRSGKFETKNWSPEALFIWSSLAKYYKHLSTSTDPFVYTTKGTIGNLTVTPDTMSFRITESGTATTEVYCQDRGEPTRVSGAESWSYDPSSRIVSINTTSSSSVRVFIDWGVLVDETLTVNTSKNGLPVFSNITLFDENMTEIMNVRNVSSYQWLLPFGTYYVQAAIFYNRYRYVSNNIRIDLQNSAMVSIDFPFSNLKLSCTDINNDLLDNCTVAFTRKYERHARYTDDSGQTTLEAYYGNWTIRAYWIGVPVGEISIEVSEPEVKVGVRCNVGDFTIVVADRYGKSVRSNVTLTNATYGLIFSGFIDETMENITFGQIPLVNYELVVSGGYGTQVYTVSTSETRQMRVEVTWIEKTNLYILIGAAAVSITSSIIVWALMKRKKKMNV